MGICYEETSGSFNGSIQSYDPNVCYMKHYRNYLYLRFIEDNSNDRIERSQAHKEILIANRKMEFWQRLIKDNSTIEKEMANERKRWQS